MPKDEDTDEFEVVSEKEKDIYNEDKNEELEESDEIDEAEEGFMKGYNEDVDLNKCSNCDKLLDNEEDFFEREFKNTTYRFCSQSCADQFESRQKKI